jgi:hypothetical protein
MKSSWKSSAANSPRDATASAQPLGDRRPFGYPADSQVQPVDRQPGDRGSRMTAETEVLIVGAGPAGISASILLSRYGVQSLLGERHQGVSAVPRSIAASARTMEIFRAWGIEGEIRAVEQELERVAVRAGTLRGPVLARKPVWEYEGPAASPCRMSPIHQDKLEPSRWEHARSYPVAGRPAG